MKQLQYFTLEHYDQLKSLSDPLRCRIVSLLIPNSLTGQQLAQELDIPRAKIHYHLNELEKNDLIAVVRNEVKNGIIQKFYRSVARGFVPAVHLLPNTNDLGSFMRQSTINAFERARLIAISAPERAFSIKSTDAKDWPRSTLQMQVYATEEQMANWYQKYRTLLQELHKLDLPEDDPNGKYYYLISSAFEVEEPWFQDPEEDDAKLVDHQAGATISKLILKGEQSE